MKYPGWGSGRPWPHLLRQPSIPRTHGFFFQTAAGGGRGPSRRRFSHLRYKGSEYFRNLAEASSVARPIPDISDTLEVTVNA